MRVLFALNVGFADIFRSVFCDKAFAFCKVVSEHGVKHPYGFRFIAGLHSDQSSGGRILEVSTSYPVRFLRVL